MLASDGLFKTLEPAEILECVGGHPQSWPQALVARTLERQRPGQDNVTVVSVTLDSESLGKFDPDAPASIFETPAQPPTPGKTLSGKVCLIAALFLLILAATFAGLWYFSGH